MAKFILRDVSTGLIVPVAAILIWQLFSSMGWVNPHVLPSPLAVVQHSSRFALKQEYGALSCYRVLKQGENTLSFYRISEPDREEAAGLE